jgi:hypothetical protein
MGLITEDVNKAINDWLAETYGDDEIIQAIRSVRTKDAHRIDELRVWIRKVAQMTRNVKRTDWDGRNLKVHQINLATLFDRSTSWVRECVKADELMNTKAGANTQVDCYLTEIDDTPFGISSFIIFLQNQ